MQQPTQETHVIYHSPCSDGTMAAAILFKKFGKGTPEYPVFYHPAQYYSAPPAMADGSDVYIVDFSYSREVLTELASRMRGIAVWDHHKSAQEALTDLNLPNVGVVFDMRLSGAGIAWRQTFPGKEMPQAVRFVQDRDLWTWHDPFTKPYTTYLRSLPTTLEVYTQVLEQSPDDVARFVQQGGAILAYESQLVERMAQYAFSDTLAGQPCVRVNASVLQSELGDYLLQKWPEMPFAAVGYKTETGIRWSLRSRNTAHPYDPTAVVDFDVSAIAKQFVGGGGHRNAAGFTIAFAKAERRAIHQADSQEVADVVA